MRRAWSLALALMPAVADQLPAQTIAITGGTVYPVSGPKIPNGTVLIRDGKIVAVGAGVSVPAGAARIDATGSWVTPGLIHAGTDLGLNQFQVGGDLETNEGNKSGDINAAFNVAEGIDPAALTIGPARIEGITTELATPGNGLIAGQAVLVDLNGDRVDDMIAKSPAAMIIDFSQSSKPAGGGSRAGALERLREIFQDAQDYAQRKADYRKAQMQSLSASAPDLEALRPVLSGELPVYAIANRRSDIESALRVAREFKLKLVIWGGAEGWKLASTLAAARVPVVIEPLHDIPVFDGLAPRLDNAALLRKAGVVVVLAQRDGSAMSRTLRYGAGNAVANGLTWDDALRAVTLSAAEALGVADRYGSLDPGKVADVVVWSGDPFEFSTGVRKLIIRGVDVPLTSRQTELLERYKTLPPKY